MRKTKTLGERRLRLCKACGRKFTLRSQKQYEDEGMEEIRDMPVQEPGEGSCDTGQEPVPRQADAGPERSSGPSEKG